MNEENNTSGISVKTWLMGLASLIILAFFAIMLIVARDVVSKIASPFVVIVASIMTCAFAGAAYMGLRHWHAIIKAKEFQSHVLRPNANNMLPAVYVEAERRMIQGANGIMPQPVPAHYAPTIHNDPAALYKIMQLGMQNQIAAPTVITEEHIKIPDEYNLMDIARRFPLSTDRLFLGRTGDGRDITVDSETQLCHGAFNAVTGRGKTIVIRGIETQLLRFGHRVIHADIKFALVDEKGNDYKPIAKSLLDQGNIPGTNIPHLLLRADHIKDMITWLSGDELTRRLTLYNQGFGNQLPVIYLFLEELAYLITIYGKDFAKLVGRILVVGRSLGVKVFTSGQNFQVQTLGIDTGMRENFESAWFLGGDDKSGASLLDTTEKELKRLQNEINVQSGKPLGRGLTFFRNNTAAPDATLMRVGMAGNDFVYHMLGKADNFAIPLELFPVISSGHGTRDTQETRHDDNLSVFPSVCTFTGHVPNEGARGLVEPLEAHPVNVPFVPLGEDKILPDDRHDELAHWYGKVGNVHAALAKMGITNSRYRRHASYIVEEMGLKARRA